MQFSHDPGDHARRLTRLTEYLNGQLLNDKDFVCSAFRSECQPSATSQGSAFIEAEMPHVGAYFSLRSELADPVRVVVLGQERGRGQPRVTMAQRTRDLQLKRDVSLRNPHLRGTVHGLVVAFGGAPAGSEYLTVDGTPRHVIDMFALTNATLCSALARKSDGSLTTKGKATPMMRRNCTRHLAAQLEILEPTILVVQGNVALSAVSKITSRVMAPGNAYEARFGDVSARVVAVAHPTSHHPTNWATPNTDYFVRVVTPLLAGN